MFLYRDKSSSLGGSTMSSPRARRLWPLLPIVGLLLTAFAAPSVAPARAATVAGGSRPSPRVVYAATPSGTAAPHGRIRPLSIRLADRHWAAPPTTADCVTLIQMPCYSPVQIQRAYGLPALHRSGLTGRGSTIVVVDAFGSPTVEADLHRFDRDFRIPDPPHLRVIQPAGRVPRFDPSNADQVGWAAETSLDVQYAHAMAPGADILLVETPVGETQGVQGVPEIVRAENYVVRHNLGDVITQSFGATEETFPSKQSLLGFRSAFVNAARNQVTVLASSGDTGPTSYQVDGSSLYPRRVNSWPSSDPLVTSVGGTRLRLDAVGNRTAPDTAWNDTAMLGAPAASGGGTSSVFPRPAYQRSVSRVVHGRRGTPDVSMSAAINGGVLVYLGFRASDVDPGYYPIGGTSESSPELAGVVAIARQRAHHRLGLVNPRLYALAGRPGSGVVDVTRGDTTVRFAQSGRTYKVPGFRATGGYDMATGLGTVDADRLTAALAR